MGHASCITCAIVVLNAWLPGRAFSRLCDSYMQADFIEFGEQMLDKQPMLGVHASKLLALALFELFAATTNAFTVTLLDGSSQLAHDPFEDQGVLYKTDSSWLPSRYVRRRCVMQQA